MNVFPSTLRLSLGLAFGALLFVGCGSPQSKLVKELDAKGYELTHRDLLLAAAAGDVAGIELFHAAGMDIDEADAAGNTALMRAAGGGQLGAVERLLGLGADPQKINGVGRDALLLASGKGLEEVARMLLARGADPSVRDKEGWSALSLASFNGHPAVVSLLSASATAAELDDALLVASFSGDPAVINVLLGQGANINARSPESRTPLMIAAESGRLEAVRVLLQNHANPFAVDPDNRTASGLAMTAGHESVSSLIGQPEKWGASPEGARTAAEMSDAREALVRGGVEETLLEGMPLAGEPERTIALASTQPVEKEAAIVKAGAPKVSDGTKQGADAAVGGKPAESAAAAAAEERAAPGGELAETKTESGTGPATVLGSGSGVASPAVRAVPVDEPEPQGRLRAEPAYGAGPGAPAMLAQVSSPGVARRVREESKSKPLVALNGSTIHARSPSQAPVREMVLAAYHEEPLPVVVEGVSGSTASVRRLDADGAIVAVEPGGTIPGTSYRVREVSPRFVSSKEGKGRMVDVSRVELEDTRSGSTHLLVKDAAGQTADTYAVLTAPSSQYRYVVKAGDVFRTTEPHIGARDYQVLDIRPNAVVIKDVASDEVLTVARDGLLEP